MVIHLSAALAATVTNPYGTGFYAKPQGKDKEAVVEAATACFVVFSSGAFLGYGGRVRLDPKAGTGFNAHGSTLPYSCHASVAGMFASISAETDPHVLIAATGVNAEAAGGAWNW
ncbi:hypothetical protein RJ639_008732 [Escallonia herrerae]|uniref:Uncharacterized protein n=1 Tax=Escallonia herrerae TaxID=1293975 RepID=A0AA88VQ64_9ASTE|nr:hypothetical protein RJ639_008732 [Escallonia herrerae]